MATQKVLVRLLDFTLVNCCSKKTLNIIKYKSRQASVRNPWSKGRETISRGAAHFGSTKGLKVSMHFPNPKVQSGPVKILGERESCLHRFSWSQQGVCYMFT